MRTYEITVTATITVTAENVAMADRFARAHVRIIRPVSGFVADTKQSTRFRIRTGPLSFGKPAPAPIHSLEGNQP